MHACFSYIRPDLCQQRCSATISGHLWSGLSIAHCYNRKREVHLVVVLLKGPGLVNPGSAPNCFVHPSLRACISFLDGMHRSW